MIIIVIIIATVNALNQCWDIIYQIQIIHLNAFFEVILILITKIYSIFSREQWVKPLFSYLQAIHMCWAWERSCAPKQLLSWTPTYLALKAADVCFFEKPPVSRAMFERRRYDVIISLLANESTAFIWKLCSHWLKAVDSITGEGY